MLSYSLFLACVLFVSLSVELLCACTYSLSLLSLTYLLVSSVLCLVLLPLSSHYIGLLSLVSCYSAVSASPNYLHVYKQSYFQCSSSWCVSQHYSCMYLLFFMNIDFWTGFSSTNKGVLFVHSACRVCIWVLVTHFVSVFTVIRELCVLIGWYLVMKH